MAHDQNHSAGPARIRQLNRSAILSHIRYKGSCSRSKLSPVLKLSPAAVSSVVNELLDEGFLRRAIPVSDSNRQGRPISLLELNPEAAYALGMILRPNGDVIEVASAWVDYTGFVRILTKLQIKIQPECVGIVTIIRNALRTLQNTVPNKDRISGLAIGIPGVVENDTIPIAPKLQCIEGSDLILKLRELIPYPVTFHNDVNLSTMSELHEQPRLREMTFCYLHIYSGVGSGISQHGVIHSGSGWAGEVGQLRIGRNNGQHLSFEQLLCTDGRLADLLSSLGHTENTLDALVPYIDARDKTVLKVIDDYCESLCDLIKVLHSVLDLDEVIVDFPSAQLFERLRPRVEVLIQDYPHKLKISAPASGYDACIRGAALTALNESLEIVELRDPNRTARTAS